MDLNKNDKDNYYSSVNTKLNILVHQNESMHLLVSLHKHVFVIML